MTVVVTPNLQAAELTEELRSILKRMWEIQSKRENNEILSEDEIAFFKIHYWTMRWYYTKQFMYWENIQNIK